MIFDGSKTLSGMLFFLRRAKILSSSGALPLYLWNKVSFNSSRNWDEVKIYEGNSFSKYSSNKVNDGDRFVWKNILNSSLS